MNIPDDRRYTDQHEWAMADGSRVRVGITDYAQDALGDVVFVDLPTVGQRVEVGDTLAEVESTKSVAEVYAPVAGTVSEVNSSLDSAPEAINSDPYGSGWFVIIDADEAGGLDEMLDALGYGELTA